VVIGKEAGPEQRNGLTGASLIVNVDGAEDGGYGRHDRFLVSEVESVNG
jgi:hypothetical protein